MRRPRPNWAETLANELEATAGASGSVDDSKSISTKLTVTRNAVVRGRRIDILITQDNWAAAIDVKLGFEGVSITSVLEAVKTRESLISAGYSEPLSVVVGAARLAGRLPAAPTGTPGGAVEAGASGVRTVLAQSDTYGQLAHRVLRAIDVSPAGSVSTVSSRRWVLPEARCDLVGRVMGYSYLTFLATGGVLLTLNPVGASPSWTALGLIAASFILCSLLPIARSGALVLHVLGPLIAGMRDGRRILRTISFGIHALSNFAAVALALFLRLLGSA